KLTMNSTASPGPPLAGRPPRRQPWLPDSAHAAPGHPRSDAVDDPAGLPAPGGDLPARTPRRAQQALCFALGLLIYLALLPRVVAINANPTGDQAFYLMTVISLVEDGDLNLANNYAAQEWTKFNARDMSILLAFSRARPASEQYDAHMPGLPFVIAPVWALGVPLRQAWPATAMVMCLVGALVGLNIFLLAYETTGRTRIAWAVWLPLAFSNPLLTYSFLLFTELPTGLLLLYAFRRLARGWRANGPGRLLLVAACIAYIPWLAWRCLPLVAVLVAYGLVQWWRARSAGGARVPTAGAAPPSARFRVGVVLWLLPLAVSAVFLIVYNEFLFGALSPPAQVPELGSQSPFLMPWAGLKEFTSFVRTGFALLFDRQMGLLTFAPIYVLTGVGAVAMLRSDRPGDRRLLGWMAALTLPYIAILMAFVFWNGIWCPPARYLTTLVPLAAAPLARSLLVLRGSRLYQGLYALLALPGLFFGAVFMDNPLLFWPANPLFGWLAAAPEAPVHIDLRGWLPAFSPLEHKRLAAGTGWMTLATVAITLLGYLLLVRRQTSVGRGRLSQATAVVLWAVVLSVAGSSWWVANAEFLPHRTELVEQHRWPTGPLTQPLGIAYLDGKVYIADYHGAVSVLDTASGAFTTLPLTDPRGAPVAYANPGDVKVGPDGLIYVLNNAPGPDGLLVLQPDGRIVRRGTLPGKSNVATALSFGPDRALYVADMIVARVRKYDRAGDQPLATITGRHNGFDNGSTVAVAPDGTIFAGEMTSEVVQEMDREGRFQREYAIHCQSWNMIVNGDWLDISCGDQILSIHRPTHTVQRSDLGQGTPPLAGATGLAAGPDNTLFVLDKDALIQYAVQR
ncbi:MAG TPA: SMP-30/gluconolactonase/LRE family protein, partial [Chloroflexia bacterium]|nr:SMP-30/gluconolactonase/LRE family protein [Chloroflexia bacterium]